MRSGLLRLALLVTVTGCLFTETKLPPEPTVEYLPCSGMALDSSARIDAFTVLDAMTAGIDEIWGGAWTEGAEWHVGLTDVGVIDWELACPRISDADLVVHEIPYPLGQLEAWAEGVESRIVAAAEPGVSQEIVVSAGQYVIEIRADTVEEAFDLAPDIPLEAWQYGGPASASDSPVVD